MKASATARRLLRKLYSNDLPFPQSIPGELRDIDQSLQAVRAVFFVFGLLIGIAFTFLFLR